MVIVKIYKSFPHIIAQAFPVNEILTFKILYLEKVGQGHGLQLSQWRHSMANIKIIKRHSAFLKSWMEARERRETAAAESLTVGR